MQLEALLAMTHPELSPATLLMKYLRILKGQGVGRHRLRAINLQTVTRDEEQQT